MSTVVTSPRTSSTRRGRPPSEIKKVVLTVSLTQITYNKLVARSTASGVFKGQLIDQAVALYLQD